MVIAERQPCSGLTTMPTVIANSPAAIRRLAADSLTRCGAQVAGTDHSYRRRAARGGLHPPSHGDRKPPTGLARHPTAVAELHPLRGHDVARYLRLATAPRRLGEWEPVFAQLADQPDERGEDAALMMWQVGPG
ncbi:MAG TPA: hypothetical protein VGO16_10020 [Pseudonocardiaceae bacterium]|nr:hypothetical protein [Pseudonocardiaceae bacterium]